ncbi:MAG: PD-(D/E)XK nuclease family protein [Proteobacteria bacterium]|nr:PD-(D/E)XK nuclease family protein [Ramlibacter sp.]MCA0215296.1 PD-(D/E)XK nuclease family protein [Pseudomonadota bacterium]
MDAIAHSHQAEPAAQAALDALMTRVKTLLDSRAAHPARTVVLVPYAQLMPKAARAWARVVPSGFAPRFESTMNWARSQGGPQGGFVPGPLDLCRDAARDLLAAQALLDSAGLGGQRELLAARVVEAAGQLAPLAAAVPPAQRQAWAARMRAVVAGGLDAPVLALEQAVARVALEWVAASAYATDCLLGDAVRQDVDCLVVLQGYQSEPLVDAIRAHFGDKAATLPMVQATLPGVVTLHPAHNAEDEAARAAACVLRHLAGGHSPVALAATDRVLTRRIRALLGAQGLRIRDETGWKLSTTRAAAHLMTALRAARHDATADAVLDWLKHAPALEGAAVQRLEAALRKAGAREWAGVVTRLPEPETFAALLDTVQAWRATLQRPRPLAHWLQALRALLQASGQWQRLAGDAAGDAAIAALRLGDAGEDADDGAAAPTEWDAIPHAARRMPLHEFTAWVTGVLEDASFKPTHPRDEQVVILPFPQMLGQPFAAAVLPGCDEANLPAAPEPAGPWTAGQRAALGLPTREALEAAQRAGWQQALAVAQVDVLWRTADAAGEPVLPSPLVQQLQLDGAARTGADPRAEHAVAVTPTPRPRPSGAALPVARLSASAYEDLRRCPYRFFALRQLGLKEADELDTGLDKRDFGTWLHAVLGHFHNALAAQPVPAGPQRLALMDEAAQEQTRVMGLAEGEFLPFAASWPQARDGYLAWLDEHEAGGAQFAQAEAEREMPLGALTLVGRLDRIDSLPGGMAMVMDYKTEALDVTRKRVKSASEDTQLAFYAALLPDDQLRAAYVNVGERETRKVEQDDVVAARDALIDGIQTDLQAIADGAPLPALGEGTVCDFCAARGLCRKDMWS